VGTASLVFGLILIGFGSYVLFILETGVVTDEEILYDFGGRLIVAIPCFVIGGLLIRKYDKDKKKEKGS